MGELVGIIDFGQGECDDVAWVFFAGTEFMIGLDDFLMEDFDGCEGGDGCEDYDWDDFDWGDCEWGDFDWEECEGSSFEEVIVEELVYSDDCDGEIVSGLIEFYLDGVLVGSIDFGDGECDGIAIVTENGETFEINLDACWLDEDEDYCDDFDWGDCNWGDFDWDHEVVFEEVIVEELVYSDDCDGEIVSGLIEFYLDGMLIGSIDFGDGECDGVATVTEDGETFEISLDECWLGNDEDYCDDFDWGDCDWDDFDWDGHDVHFEEVIVEELVVSDDCDGEIVSGLIEFYLGGELIGSIDFGDGECDGVATVTEDGETFEISLDECWVDEDGECEDFDWEDCDWGDFDWVEEED
jgi:hypothetical protein